MRKYLLRAISSAVEHCLHTAGASGSTPLSPKLNIGGQHMNGSIWQAIAETPWWVYPLVYYMFYLSYLGTKPRIMPLQYLMLSATSFILISTLGIIYFVNVDISNPACWIVMFLLGAGLGWLHFGRLKVKGIEGAKKILMPGSVLPFCIIVAVLSVKYFFSDQISVDPDVLRTGLYSRGLMTLYGFCTGLFFGRIVYVMRVLKFGPFTPDVLPAH